MRITDTATYFLTWAQGSFSQTHLRHPIPFLRGLPHCRPGQSNIFTDLPTRSLSALMWDPCTHTDDMLETVLINVAYMYLSGLKLFWDPTFFITLQSYQKEVNYLSHIFLQRPFWNEELFCSIVFVDICMHMFVEPRGQCQVSSSTPPHIGFRAESLTEPEDYQFEFGCSAHRSSSSALRLQVCITPSFEQGIWTQVLILV